MFQNSDLHLFQVRAPRWRSIVSVMKAWGLGWAKHWQTLLVWEGSSETEAHKNCQCKTQAFIFFDKQAKLCSAPRTAAVSEDNKTCSFCCRFGGKNNANNDDTHTKLKCHIDSLVKSTALSSCTWVKLRKGQTGFKPVFLKDSCLTATCQFRAYDWTLP